MYRATKIKSQSCKGKKEESSKSAAQSPFVFQVSEVSSLAFKLWDHSSVLLSAGELLTPGSKSTWGQTMLCAERIPVEIFFLQKSHSTFLTWGWRWGESTPQLS